MLCALPSEMPSFRSYVRQCTAPTLSDNGNCTIRIFIRSGHTGVSELPIILNIFLPILKAVHPVHAGFRCHTCPIHLRQQAMYYVNRFSTLNTYKSNHIAYFEILARFQHAWRI